jgi:hypothetical protein
LFWSRLYRLRPDELGRKRGYARIFVGQANRGPGEVYLPLCSGLPMILRSRRGGAPVNFTIDGAVLESVSWFDAVAALGRRQFTSLRRSVLRYGHFEVFPEGSKNVARVCRKSISVARKSGRPFDGPLVVTHPELMRGWQPGPRPPNQLAEKAGLRIAVSLHLYYVDLWDEFETLLFGWRVPFQLFVTLNEPDKNLEARVLASFPGSSIRIVENRGRDVRPFLILLEEGAFEPYDLVCKVHGKRSLGGGRFPIFGDVMRRIALLDLIANGPQIEAMLHRFAADHRLGLVGPQSLLSRSCPERPRDAIGPVNRAAVEAIAARLGAPICDETFDFFDGTMFWVRPRALRRLRDLGLSREFKAEAGHLDGALEHAIERIFNHAVRVEGYKTAVTSASSTN